MNYSNKTKSEFDYYYKWVFIALLIAPSFGVVFES